MPTAKSSVILDHVARETPDIRRFIDFYHEVFGFEEIAAFDLETEKVRQLYLPGVLTIHVIQKKSVISSKPLYRPSPISEFEDIPCVHHLCFTVSNFDSLVQTLNLKGIETFLTDRAPADERVKTIFFYDSDGSNFSTPIYSEYNL